ncbi:MAG TPA: hypothetical protein VFI14_00425 [Chryseosolibacter sp.]|nr:hypothetical protein [Chryseosolibacter sp.]
MLKWLAILALTLAVFPVEAHAQSNQTKDADQSGKPAAPIPVIVPQQTGSQSVQPTHEKHVDADVRIISAPGKDSYDKAAFWATIALVLVGVAGVGIGIRTLRFLKKQTGEIKRQADQMEAQLKEMKSTREVETKILFLQYRPKIIVRGLGASDFNFTELNQPMTVLVRFTAVNTGGTGALITGGFAKIVCGAFSDARGFEFLEGPEENIGEFVLQPGQGVDFRRTMQVGTINDPEWIEALKTGESRLHKFMYLSGLIRYKDELNIPRQTAFMRSYNAKEGKFAPNTNSDEEYAD